MPVQNYEILNPNTDVTTTRTLLHEAIPVTGTILSATYGTFPNEGNIKNFTHGMFQSVYDYPYLSSSANHIFDITMGYDEGSALSASSGYTMQKKKINIYNQFAQVLLGYTGSNNQVEIFESDLDYGDNDRQMKECFFLNFSRLLSKDQIKPGTFSLVLGAGSWETPFASLKTLTDASASITRGTKTTPGGEYGVLYSASSGDSRCGLVFYEAGIVVLTGSIFGTSSVMAAAGADDTTEDFYHTGSTDYAWQQQFVTGTMSGTCNALRHRVSNVSYNNTTEINSTIYFCRVPHNKYNYSSNPTYTSGSKIVVKNVASDLPVSYITTVGLYNSANELLAVAKLSEPLRKDPNNVITLRVRLDY